MSRKNVRDSILENKTVLLDGTSWWACTFTNCELIMSEGDYSLEHCTLNGCRLSVNGKALTILATVELFYPGCIPFVLGNRPDPGYHSE